jgi:hypothetical protein
VRNPRYPGGVDARSTAAYLIDLLQKQIQLPIAYIRQRASLQPGCAHLCEGATLQHQPCNIFLNMGLVGVFIVYLMTIDPQFTRNCVKYSFYKHD